MFAGNLSSYQRQETEAICTRTFHIYSIISGVCGVALVIKMPSSFTNYSDSKCNGLSAKTYSKNPGRRQLFGSIEAEFSESSVVNSTKFTAVNVIGLRIVVDLPKCVQNQ